LVHRRSSDHGERNVTELVYRLHARLSKLVGLWPVRFTASLVAAGYFVCFSRRRRHSIRFYRGLFPERSRWFATRCAWRQFQDFARLYSERLEVERRNDISFERDGDDHVAKAKAAGRGVILLMSHFGRWEIGARLLAEHHRELTLVMGGQVGGQARAGVDRDLRNAGVDVVTVPEGQGQSFDILQAVEVLRQGGIVSLAADRVFGDARRLRMPFLGHAVGVAAAPFALALVSGAPLLTVFAMRTGTRRYRFVSEPPMVLSAASRRERQAVMEKAAAAYLDRLQAVVKSYPEQWQTFEGFFMDDDERATRSPVSSP
jgi:lauroyl/myristoyl acyltransferase